MVYQKRWCIVKSVMLWLQQLGAWWKWREGVDENEQYVAVSVLFMDMEMSWHYGMTRGDMFEI